MKAWSMVLLWWLAGVAQAADGLPSWNAGPVRDAIVTFVESTTKQESPAFVPVEQRIATFDNDGTLWAEQPVYFQMLFTLDRIRAMSAQHPEWKQTEPYRSAIAGDMKGLAASGEKGLMELLATTHAGMSTDEFSATVTEWIRTARHPVTKRPYTAMIYQPMRELLDYLRAHGYKTYIVSGGSQEFMRPWVEQAYGIPPEQVIGSYGELEYRIVNGRPQLFKLAKAGLVDDHGGKPVGIQRFIGRRPVFAFGNSDGDLEMLQWTTAGEGVRFAGLVHHTDDAREWAYDRQSKIGTLDHALDLAGTQGWTVVDMARDWKVVFPAAEGGR